MLDQAPNLLLREAQEIQVNGATTTSTPKESMRSHYSGAWGVLYDAM